MAGLGLSNAVGDAIDIYRSGKRQTADDAYRADERKYQGEQRARATMLQGRDDAAYALDQKANDAARQALQSVQQPQGLAMPGAEMPAGQDGQPGLAMPTQVQAAPRKLMPADYLKAFDAQANVYAGAGDVNKLMESEAKAYPLRTQVRNEGLGQALSDYKSHQDPIKLAQAAYPLLRDGNEITGAKNLGGTIEFTLSNGTKQVVKPEQVAEQIQYAMLNPQKVAEMEMGARIEAMKAEAKGKEDRLTLGVKQTGDMGVETLKQSGALGLADVNNKASLDRTMQQGKNSLAVAGIGANATMQSARIRSDAGSAEAALANGKAPPGYMWGPKDANGVPTMQAVKGGPADLKISGQLNADTQALSGATSGLDRLAVAANEVLKSPGLKSVYGLRGVVPNIPGGSAADAQALLNTLKSQVGFSVLQDMRNNSKTGGALGAVSDKENAMLQANLAALEKAQSFEQAQKSLAKIIDFTDQSKGRLQEAYNMKHKAGDRAPVADTAPRPAAGGGLNITTPDGKVHSFPSAEAADKFKKAAGL